MFSIFIQIPWGLGALGRGELWPPDLRHHCGFSATVQFSHLSSQQILMPQSSPCRFWLKWSGSTLSITCFKSFEWFQSVVKVENCCFPMTLGAVEGGEKPSELTAELQCHKQPIKFYENSKNKWLFKDSPQRQLILTNTFLETNSQPK